MMNFNDKLNFQIKQKLFPEGLFSILSGGIFIIVLDYLNVKSYVFTGGIVVYILLNIYLVNSFLQSYKKREKELEEKSLMDNLTGLKNMRYFEQRVEELLARYNREGEPFALIFIDLDDFKKCNDQYGHTTGNKLLQRVGNFLQEITRREDTLVRYGGDEFILLSPDTSMEKAHFTAQRINEEFSQETFLVNGYSLTLKLSGGVAVCPDDGTDLEQLLEVADKNLYQAKENGNNVTSSRRFPEKHKSLIPPFIIGEKDYYLEKIEKKTTQIYLLAKQGDLEIMRQTIAQDKVFLIEGEKSHFELYYLVQGEIIRERDEKILGPGSFISVNNSTDEIYFKTRTEVNLLYITTTPIFNTKQEEFRELIALNEEVAKKDSQTKAHCSRLEKLSLQTGEKMGLEDDMLFKLDYASFLHDVGKINISSEILKKNGKLTKKEWLDMKKHSVWGRELILDHLGKEFFKDVAEIVHQHHEKYDGSGYPRGLKGNQIMKEAQILTVVDSYDAMTSDRPYRKALSRKEARKELQNEKGKHFSPEVVDAFLDVEEKLFHKNEI